MALMDIWDYLRASGDRRLREQGYVRSGVGLLERYRRVPQFWGPHLEHNRANLRELAGIMNGGATGAQPAGTLLVLGAGRLLDVPWEELFPFFERVVLFDADACVVPYVERLIGASKQRVPKPVFEIGDLTSSVVDVAAWAQHTIQNASAPKTAAVALREGFERAGTPQPEWARAYVDVRMVVSTNLLSQLGYFPRKYIQECFQRRFNEAFTRHGEAAEALECYFDRVRARHVHDMASFRKACVYVSCDIDVVVYKMERSIAAGLLTSTPPPHAGVELDANGQVKFGWPGVQATEHSDPLHKQKVADLWPSKAGLMPPRRWVWHIVPQNSEKTYPDTGRVHIVEAWLRRGGN